MIKYTIKIIGLLFIVVLFLSCGYRPSAKYAREIIGNTVSTSVKISLVEPENTVQIKDALDSAILEVFHTSLKAKGKAKTHLDIEMRGVEYIPLAFDDKGFVIAYRSKTLLYITRYKDQYVQLYKTYGTYDFSIVANAVITDSERYNAIKYGAKKAIRSFMSQVTSQGVK